MDDREELERRIRELEAERDALTEESRFLEGLLDAVDDTVFVFDPATGEALRWNRAFRELSGASDEEIARRKAPDAWYDAEDLSRAGSALEELVATGRARAALELVTVEGQRVPTEYSVTLLEGAEGQAPIAVSVGRDISKRLEAESTLAANRALIDALVHQSATSTWISDERGTLLELNQACCDLLHITPEEVVGRYNVLADNIVESQGHMDEVRAVFERGTPASFILSYDSHELASLELQEKATVHLSVTIIPIKDASGAVTHAVFQHIDQTGLKVAEARLRQAEKMEAIGTLAGGIAHDFNNLLMGIQGHVSLMKLDLGDHPTCQDHCEEIEKVVQSATALTQQLLGFARGGKYQVQPSDANALVSRTVQMFARTRRQLRVHMKAAEDLWTVEVDRSQIEQVVLNLLVNAWQAMPEGGDLYIETRNIELDEATTRPFEVDPGRFIQISVTDTGVGMDKETLARVFEPFFTTRKMGRGTGLGLASSYGILRSHGGLITAYSEPGEGATFNVYLPASDKAVARESRPARQSQSGSETILLIDDEEVVLRVTSRLLERLGYQVIAAGSGREGIERFEAERQRVDLIILDMILPGESPQEVFAALRERSPEVKILLCSGYSLNGQASALLDLGCQGFLQKPFQLASLSSTVRQVLEG